MGKRANPFVEDFIPQSKVHVGPKQFNNNDERLKKVYEKTLNLLFQRTTKPQPQYASHESDIISNKKDKMKQLFIGKDGLLLHSGCLVSNNGKAKQCSCGSTVEAQCAYCDTILCGSCQHACTHCEKAYCTHCILVGSEGLEVCVSCYH